MICISIPIKNNSIRGPGGDPSGPGEIIESDLDLNTYLYTINVVNTAVSAVPIQSIKQSVGPKGKWCTRFRFYNTFITK